MNLQINNFPKPIFDLFYYKEDDLIRHKETDLIASDGNGTVYGNLSDVEPELTSSPCHDALTQWLNTGGKDLTHLFLLITAREFLKTNIRFIRHIPQELRAGLLISTDGGALLYYHDREGNIYEDMNYRKNAVEGGTGISLNLSQQIVSQGVRFINEFWEKFNQDASFFEKIITFNNGRFNFLTGIFKSRKTPYLEEDLVSLDSKQVPRIEISKTLDETTTSISFIGIPSIANEINFSSLESSCPTIQVTRIILTTQITMKGVDKALPLKYLNPDPRQVVTIGDSPHENDAPLTKYKWNLESRKIKVRFVSVCNFINKVPPKLLPFHIGHNMEGTARLIGQLTLFSKEKKKEERCMNNLENIVKAIQLEFANKS